MKRGLLISLGFVLGALVGWTPLSAQFNPVLFIGEAVAGATTGNYLYVNGSVLGQVNLATAAIAFTNKTGNISQWTNDSGYSTGGVTSIATTSPISGGTITGTGTLSLLVNVDFAWTVPQSVTNAGIAATSTDGFTIANTTAATSGVAVQQSPRLRFRSQVWNTTSVAATNTNDFFLESVPVSGTTPSGLFKVGSSLNGAAATYPLTLTSGGNLAILGGVISTSTTIIKWSSDSRAVSAANAGLVLVNASGVRYASPSSSGVGWVVGSDGFLGWSSTTDAPGGLDAMFGRSAAATIQMGANVNGAPVTQTFKAHNGVTGTDVAGATLNLTSGIGTGSGTISTVTIGTPTVGSTGTTPQSIATRVTIDSSGLMATGYKSSDGTVGLTATCTLLSITSFVVKNGLVTACS